MTVLALNDVLSCPTLPTLPKVAMDVLELARDPEVNVHDIAAAVQYDPALSSKILKTVNSSYFGLPHPCPTIHRAVGYLGLDAIKTLVLGFSLTEVTRSEQMATFDLKDFWRRSIYAAAAVRHLARRIPGCDPEEAFTAALLQDIGMLAIHSAATDPYLEILELTQGDHEVLPRIETETLQFTHADAGALLAERWRLPESLVEPIRRHHPDENCRAVTEDLTRLVRLSFRVSHLIDAPDQLSELKTLWGESQEWFNLTIEEVNAVVRHTGDDARSLSSLFGVEIGDVVDVNRMLAEAEDARIAHSLALQRQSSDLQRTNEVLSKQASTDGLTGAANRSCFDVELESAFQNAVEQHTDLGLIFVDADHFKKMNDTHGHQAGDSVLVELTRRMISVAGDQGLVCRYGGEEFAIILPDCDLKKTALLAENIRVHIAATPFDLRNTGATTENAHVTVSLGVAAVDHHHSSFYTTAAQLLNRADEAVYAAKEAGRNCARVIRPKNAA